MKYKELFPAKAGRYFTGRCLALEIELFRAEGADLDNFVLLCCAHQSGRV